jgi:hypothetical protein
MSVLLIEIRIFFWRSSGLGGMSETYALGAGVVRVMLLLVRGVEG